VYVPAELIGNPLFTVCTVAVNVSKTNVTRSLAVFISPERISFRATSTIILPPTVKNASRSSTAWRQPIHWGS